MLSRRWYSARTTARHGCGLGARVRVLVCVLICVLSCALVVANCQAGAVRIALLAEAKIPGDAIVLADLLPSGVPARVRALADSILLGKTPQSGTSRYLRAATVAEAIERAGTAPSSFEIPEMIAVQRLDRPLDGEEILASIRHAIAKFPLSSGQEAALLALQQGNLNWDAALRVPLGDARLQAREISVDLVAGRAEIRMTAESLARSIVFAVVAKIPCAELAAVQDANGPAIARQVTFHGASRAQSLTPSAQDPAVAPLLIAAGHRAQLHLHSEHSSILLEVQALQAGRAGETIRVRLPVSGRTLRAQVTGFQILDAVF